MGGGGDYVCKTKQGLLGGAVCKTQSRVCWGWGGWGAVCKTQSRVCWGVMCVKAGFVGGGGGGSYVCKTKQLCVKHKAGFVGGGGGGGGAVCKTKQGLLGGLCV